MRHVISSATTTRDEIYEVEIIREGKESRSIELERIKLDSSK